MEGSIQLRRYLSARKHGWTMTTAAVEAGMSIAEARLTEADMAAGRLDHITNEMPSPITPPATEAALGTATLRESANGVREQGAIIAAPKDGPASTTSKETIMARGRKPKSEQVEQVIAPDFSLAVSIYRNDIRPAQSKVGEHSQEMSEAYKAIKKRANIQPRAARLAFQLDNMEESKRDDFLRSLNGLLKTLNIFMPTDLVDQAQGKSAAGEEVIPAGKGAKPALATMGMH